MPVESANFVAGLDENAPPSGDPKSQGDDHLRLIKKVLKNTFPNATGAITGRQRVEVKAGGFSVTIADLNVLFVLNVPDTAGAQIDALLPSGLTVADAGWECSFVKIGFNVNPYFLIVPGGQKIQSGELGNLDYARRAIPGHRIRVFWGGSYFIAERVPRVPIGTILDFNGTTEPWGYKWANGATLTPAAGYLEYFQVAGSVIMPDLRGRVAAGKDDMGGTSANRLTTPVDGDVLRAAGGAEAVTIAQNQLPNVAPPFVGNSQTVSSNQGPIWKKANIASGTNDIGAGSAHYLDDNPSFTFTPTGTVGSINGGVPQQLLSVLQPTMILNKIVVVE